jgi:hypothetical protein
MLDDKEILDKEMLDREMLDREMLDKEKERRKGGKEERKKKLNYKKALISLVRKGKQPLRHKQYLCRL